MTRLVGIGTVLSFSLLTHCAYASVNQPQQPDTCTYILSCILTSFSQPTRLITALSFGITFSKVLHPCVSGALLAEVSLSQLIHIQRIQVWSVDLVVNFWHTRSVVVPVKVPTQGAAVQELTAGILPGQLPGRGQAGGWGEGQGGRGGSGRGMANLDHTT